MLVLVDLAGLVDQQNRDLQSLDTYGAPHTQDREHLDVAVTR